MIPPFTVQCMNIIWFRLNGYFLSNGNQRGAIHIHISLQIPFPCTAFPTPTIHIFLEPYFSIQKKILNHQTPQPNKDPNNIQRKAKQTKYQRNMINYLLAKNPLTFIILANKFSLFLSLTFE